MNRSYEKALDTILAGDRINITTLHDTDRHAIAQLFDYLVRSGRYVGGAERIGDYVQAKGATENVAIEIQHIYEVIEALHHGGPAWTDEFLRSLLENTEK
jgi:hypothetical protein